MDPNEVPDDDDAASGDTKPRRAPGPARPAPIAEIDALSGDPSFMTSLARGLAVIRAFSERRKSMTIAQISQKTGIPRAAVRRCLFTLAQLGYVSDDNRSFSLLPKVMSLGHAYLSSTPLPVMAQPFLDHVRETLHEACSLAILDGDDILYIARSATTTRIMSVDLKIGSRLPAYCTSMGRVLLAAMPQAELDAYLLREELKPLTDRTITSRASLLQALTAVRQNGWAIVDQELELGLRSLAVPIHDTSGTVMGAMNVSVQAARVPVKELETRFLPVLLEASRELSMQLL